MRVLVTGAAGFIGMHVASRLLDDGAAVLGVDNFDPYYDVALKEARLERLSGRAGFEFRRLDLADDAPAAQCFRDGGFTHVVHLAAQPADRHVHDIGVTVEVHVPHLLGDDGPGQHFTPAPDQQGEQREFLRSPDLLT
jgi:nucleoside-diphosphate-sugar epimerase